MTPPTRRLLHTWGNANTLAIIRLGYIRRTLRTAMLLLLVAAVAIEKDQIGAAWDAMHLFWGFLALVFLALVRNHVTIRRIDRNLARWTDGR